LKETILLGFFLLIFSLGAGQIWAQPEHSQFRDTEQCLECHEENIDRKKYEDSKHGNLECISCHDFNEAGGQADIAEKCGGCHSDATEDYNQSVHKEADYGPGCDDCHGDSHYISSAGGTGSLMHRTNLAGSCGKCHAQVEVSYKESFHGKAVALGSKNSPDCTYCHGSHLVLSSLDPESLTNPAHKPELCTKCHTGNVLGVGGVEHYTLKPEGYSAPMYWVKKAFMWLILLVVGFFLIHILLDLIYKLRTKKFRP
jgi:predicted CXXCH cytochrome family protein